MKNIIKSSVLALGVATIASAQVPAGQTGLIAGWDFSNARVATTLNVIPALFTDTGTYGDISAVFNNTGSTASFVSKGSIKLDGSNGSSSWLVTGTVGSRNGTVTSTDLDDAATGKVINSFRRNSSSDLLFNKGFAINGAALSSVYETLDGAGSNQTSKAAWYNLRSTASADKFSIALDTTGFSGIVLKFNAQIGANAPAISWSYSTNGGASTTALGVTNTLGASVGQYTVDFSAITGLNDSTGAVLIGQITQGTTARLDNVQVLGTAVAAIPEPSTYAALAGFAGLGLALVRRRRVSK